MFPCDPVGLELIDTARFRSTNSIDLPLTPEQLWQVLEDEEAWPQWSYVTRMSWTGPRPLGIGTTRAIETRSGGHVVDEVIAWHPQAHLAFRVTWILAHDPKNPPLLAKLVAGRVMDSKYREYLKKLRSYTERRFGVSI